MNEVFKRNNKKWVLIPFIPALSILFVLLFYIISVNLDKGFDLFYNPGIHFFAISFVTVVIIILILNMVIDWDMEYIKVSKKIDRGTIENKLERILEGYDVVKNKLPNEEISSRNVLYSFYIKNTNSYLIVKDIRHLSIKTGYFIGFHYTNNEGKDLSKLKKKTYTIFKNYVIE